MPTPRDGAAAGAAVGAKSKAKALAKSPSSAAPPKPASQLHSDSEGDVEMDERGDKRPLIGGPPAHADAVSEGEEEAGEGDGHADAAEAEAADLERAAGHKAVQRHRQRLRQAARGGAPSQCGCALAVCIVAGLLVIIALLLWNLHVCSKGVHTHAAVQQQPAQQGAPVLPALDGLHETPATATPTPTATPTEAEAAAGAAAGAALTDSVPAADPAAAAAAVAPVSVPRERPVVYRADEWDPAFPDRKPHYRAVVLILAEYASFLNKQTRRVWQHYMDARPKDIRVFFTYGTSATGPDFDMHPEYDLVSAHVEENYYPGMFNKTVQAMGVIDAHFTFDFFVRTNIGTFWDWDMLLEHLKVLPSQLCYSGDGPFLDEYVSGVDTIVNQDMIHSLVTHPDQLAWDIEWEDRAMGRYFHGVLGAPFLPNRIFFMESYSVNDPEIVRADIKTARAQMKDHYRVKNYRHNGGGDRVWLDLMTYKVLLKELYAVDIDFPPPPQRRRRRVL